MAQRVIEDIDTEAKLKKALLDKETELRRFHNDVDRCSTLQHSCTAALSTRIAQALHCGRAKAVTYDPPVVRHVPTWHTTDNGTGLRGCRRRCGAWAQGGHICTGTGLVLAQICTGTGLAPPHLQRRHIGAARVRGALPSQDEGGARRGARRVRRGARRVRRRSSSPTSVCSQRRAMLTAGLGTEGEAALVCVAAAHTQRTVCE